MIFFFSSRRRHTRLQGDWSSDVCSSDLRRELGDGVQESNENAQVLLDSIADFAPEFASYLGVEGHDDQGADLKPRAYERGRDATEKADKERKARRAKATDPAVRQDLEIMIQTAPDNQHTRKL